MTLLVKVALGVVILIVLAIILLRLRKLRRDEHRDHLRRVDPRLVSPPPSPYAASKGFRLLDGEVLPSARAEPRRPRLEPADDYVFGDTPAPPLEAAALARVRHETQWALSRSAHRSRSPLSVLVILVLVVLVAGGIVAAGYYARHPHKTTTTLPGAHHDTTASSTTTTSTTSTWPASFTAASVVGEDATYRVPAASYVVVVSGTNGEVWTVYRMGSANTLEYQGAVKRGSSESLRMIGESQITLGSPGNATVTVGGSPVVLPSPLVAPLTLVFTPSG